MNREELDKYISESYGIEGEHPWEKYPKYTVYRHPSNKKWFAVAMEISKKLLGIDGEGKMDIVNLKCDPIVISDLIAEGGFYPAYHMNKTYWISVPLDGTKDADTVKWLLGISYDLTNTRKRGKNGNTLFG